ncbi:MAG: DUF1643 domain-containing protein [Hyphomonadaceae bacterium]|nr:DUF1643 domain-containing protein [Hyphomonadaceae bacterium]
MTLTPSPEVKRLVSAREGVACGAILSACERYRYSLDREWHDLETKAPRRLTWIMLNPSTADHEADDPTIRRCISFARATGCNAIRVVNLFAFRATEPDDMRRASDPVGPMNDAFLAEAFADAKKSDGLVVAAWGAHGSLLNRDAVVVQLARAAGVHLLCLGLTGACQPKHPLYIKANQPFVPFARNA